MELINKINDNDIVRILSELRSPVFDEDDEKIIFNTIACHPETASGESNKLYYYKSSKSFVCWTNCGKMSLFDLIMRSKKIEFKEALKYIKKILGYDFEFEPKKGFGTRATKSKAANMNEVEIEKLETIDKPYLYKLFPQMKIKEWEVDNIDFKTIEKFNIHYNTKESQIIIPHFSWDSEERTIGIRVRNLDPYKIEHYGKYNPMWHKGTCYNHKTGTNLYGFNYTQKAIKRDKKAILFEGEKSVLQMDSIYRNNNPSVAGCGSHFSRMQKKILLDAGVEEIIIAYDKQFKQHGDLECIEWMKKIVRMIQDIKDLVKVTLIWDTKGLLGYKDSPIDKGQEVFEKLLKDRIDITNLEG
nr:hypothetical protein [Clostridioides sp.]